MEPALPADLSPTERALTEPGEPRRLPSGRSVLVRADERGERVEIRSPGGELELRIALTESGPVLTLRGARLEIDSTDTVAVNCRRFELNTTEGVALKAAGDIDLRSAAEFRLKTQGDTWIDGKMVMLNCKDRTGYPDHQPLPAPGTEAGPASPAGDAACGCPPGNTGAADG